MAVFFQEMDMVRFVFIVMLLLPIASQAAACDAGYYLSDGICAPCISGYYCPDENTIIKCPKSTQDWNGIFTNQGYDVISVSVSNAFSYNDNSSRGYKISHCYIDVTVVTTIGVFLYEPNFGTDSYITTGKKLWYNASPGRYLSSYSWTSYKDWYSENKPCTNAPPNAHYTGAGTPDANDCPWECDEEYGLHNGECIKLCNAGIQHIKTEAGISLNLYPTSYSSPALAVRYNNTVCFGILIPGASKNTININVAGKIYHVKN